MSGQAWEFAAQLDGVFTVIPTYSVAGARVMRGRKAFSAWPRPSEFTCEVADDLLQYDPSRPSSLLYGVAGRNTVVRFRTQGLTRLWGEASWAPTRTADHVPGAGRGRAGVAVTGAGVLERLGQWEDPVRSPMFLTISARPTSRGHWDLEGPRGAVRLSNSLDGGVGGVASGGAELGDDEAPLGAASSARVADGSRLAGTFANMSASAGWQVSWSFRADALPPSATTVEFFRFRTANGYLYRFESNNGSFTMKVTDSDGTSLANEVWNFGAGASPDQWLTMRIGASQSGGNVSWGWSWYPQQYQLWYSVSGSFAGAVSRPVNWEQLGNATTDGWWFSHVFGVTGISDALMDPNAIQVFNGYKGETAGSRYQRLLREAGIARFALGEYDDTQPMGAQKPSPLIELLGECVRTEDADLSDERAAIGTTFTTRRYMYGLAAAPVMALTRAELSSYEKSIGREGVANRIVAKDATGEDVTVALESGPMSVLPVPGGVGETRKQVDVSVADTGRQLESLARWYLAKGTLGGPRYTSITLDLVASPSLATVSVREGDFITVADVEPDPVLLQVVGIERVLTSGTHLLTFHTEPGDPYDVGVWDDAGFRWGTALSFLDGEHTSTDNTLALTTTSRHGRWSTSFTGDLIIAGERVTVTSMGAASGSGPYTQTATVVRSVNGVVKALPAGSQVMLFGNKRWGL